MRAGGGLAALLVLSLACQPTSGGAAHTEAIAFDGELLPPRARGAWRRLLTSGYHYGNPYMGILSEPARPALDACALVHGGYDDALVQLAREAPPGGSLWALRALRLVDRERFELLAGEFADDNREVQVTHGCVGTVSTYRKALAVEVRGEPGLATLYAQLYEQASIPEWLAGWRERATLERVTTYIRPEGSRAALQGLVDAEAFGDSTSAHSQQVLHLLEHQHSVLDLAFALINEGSPVARLWGARLLAHGRPRAFAALRAELEADTTSVPCQHADELVHHTPREALALHVDTRN